MEDTNFVHGYHDLLRPEILDRVPKTAKRILDLGCGTGRLGKAIKERQECVVTEIEVNEGAVQEAKKDLDNVYALNLDNPRTPKYGQKYDCLIFADILEHLLNPWGVFLQETANMEEHGTIIISIPNIANDLIIKDLQKGLFRYSKAGILDITHLRFFTKTSFSTFLAAHDFKITSIAAHPSKEDPIQWIFTVQKIKVNPEPPLITLIMPTHNTLIYTRLAITSIFAHTRIPFKLIVVDNNSNDGTVQMLRENKRLLHIENSVNLGFPTAVNAALECVTTPYFAILNSDIIVTDKWLTHMLEVMLTDPKNGIVGPRSNYVSGPQMLKCEPFKSGEDLQRFAVKRMEKCTLFPSEFSRIVFFCVLLKTELLDKVGILDEIFGMGNFEDDDYCIRTTKAGYRCVIDNAVFIFHFGSKTFQTSNQDYKKSIEKNLAIFKKKWHIK